MFPVFVHGGILRELRRKFVGFFKWPKSTKPGPFYDKCNLCTFGPCTPMIWPTDDKDFDASKDASTILKYVRPLAGERFLNIDQKVNAANILTKRSAPQRTAMAEAFLKKYYSQIDIEIGNTMVGGFRYFMFMEALSVPLPVFYNRLFQFAIDFQNKVEYCQEQGQAIIVETLTTIPKCLLDKAIELYNSKDRQDLIPDLEKALKSADKPSEYREVIKKMTEEKRDTNLRASWFKALREAYKLKSAVITKRETEMKERFAELFIKRSIPQILETIVVYDNLRHGEKDFQSLSDDIEKYNGLEKEIYTTMMRLIKNKPLYYAKILEGILKSGKKESEYEKRLVYIIAGRYDIDLKDIVEAYNELSKTGLRADFEAWNTSRWGVIFHEIMLDIIDKASSKP